MISAIAIDTAKGRLLDEGPDYGPDDDEFEEAKHVFMSVQGIVRQPIHGPRDETRGAHYAYGCDFLCSEDEDTGSSR
jgi:hypothetical protein